MASFAWRRAGACIVRVGVGILLPLRNMRGGLGDALLTLTESATEGDDLSALA